jgi:restriction system protein
VTTAWVIRAGKYGERVQWALDNGVSGGGWPELPDLTGYETKDSIAALTAQVFSTASPGKLNNYAGQLWALRGRIDPGNLLVLPLQAAKQIAIGTVTEGYTYLGASEPPDQRHVVKVDWEVTDLPRAIVKQDLLFTLGSAMSIFSPRKNDAAARLQHLKEHREDPGARAAVPPVPGPVAVPDDGAVDEPEVHPDFEQGALDQITTRVHEEFAGHGLTDLVAAVLAVEGYRCVVSPPGPDGGIDITAGRGPLGLDPPRLVVQVKSGGQVGSPVVSQLQGVMSTHQADQGLLVAWEGLTSQAKNALKNQHLRIRVWEADDVVDAVLRVYAELPALHHEAWRRPRIGVAG